LKWFAITDEYTPECSALEVDRGVTADRVMDILTNVFLTRRVRRHIRSDNGPEFIATGIRRHGEQASLAVDGVAASLCGGLNSADRFLGRASPTRTTTGVKKHVRSQ
jgi:hypothetical protein